MSKDGKYPKGIGFNKRSGKFLAQFWDSNTKHIKCIGLYDTVDEAILAREEFITNHLLYNGQVLKKVNKYPKGIQAYSTKKKGLRYRADFNVLWGKYNNKMVTVFIGIFNSMEEAVEARKQFILKLL